MNKDHILKEIKRTAQANGGVPLGQERFLRETGIKKSDWYGSYWARWGDAIREAGLAPNSLQAPYEVAVLFDHYIALTRELGHLPTDGEMRLRNEGNSKFPSVSTYQLKFSSKSALVTQLAQYCQDKGAEYEDIVRLCGAYTPRKHNASNGEAPDTAKIGFVYLFKHGSRPEYKIGKTFNPIRREGEISVQLPEKLEPIHYIKTDDPAGIESYWHKRFAAKRKEGEWFELTADDVRTFKRWSKIY